MAQIHVSHSPTGLQITLPHGAGDAKALSECLNALAGCAEQNKCLDHGLSFTEKCVQTIARHEEAAKCFAAGFGLRKKG